MTVPIPHSLPPQRGWGRYRIGVDARLNAYRDGGIAEYTRRLSESFRKMATDPGDQPLEGLDFTLIQHRRALNTSTRLPDDPYRSVFTYTPPHHLLERIAFGAECAIQRLDLLHSPDFIPPAFGARRYVITVMDLSFLILPETQTRHAQRYYAGQIGVAVRQAAHILCISHATKADLIRLLNVPESRITVQHLGVNPVYKPLRADQVDPVLAQYGLKRGYILFVGTLEPRKNIPALIAAHAVLSERHPGFPPLVIVGRRGWNDSAIHEQIAAHRSRVQWIEDAPFASLPALYNGAALHVLPSLYEGFGFPTLEAMACGVPVIAANTSSLPEVIGEVGLLFDPTDPDSLIAALDRGVSDTTFQARSRAEGLIRAPGFSWDQAARIAVGVYRQVLSG